MALFVIGRYVDHPPVGLSPGEQVLVVSAWRHINAHYVGKGGWIIRALPPGSTYDFEVKFPAVRQVRFADALRIPGVFVSFRVSELRRADDQSERLEDVVEKLKRLAMSKWKKKVKRRR